MSAVMKTRYQVVRICPPDFSIGEKDVRQENVGESFEAPFLAVEKARELIQADMAAGIMGEFQEVFLDLTNTLCVATFRLWCREQGIASRVYSVHPTGVKLLGIQPIKTVK